MHLVMAVMIIGGTVFSSAQQEWDHLVWLEGGLTPELAEMYNEHVRPKPPIVLPVQARRTPPPPAVFPPGVEQWRSLISQYDWPVDIMLNVMSCESGGNHVAASPTDDHGLLQIHYPIWGPHFGVTRQDLYQPELNIQLAHQIYQTQGLTAWTCYRRLY